MKRTCPDVLACAKELGWSHGTFSRSNMAVRLEDQVVALMTPAVPDHPKSPRGNVSWDKPPPLPPGHGVVAAGVRTTPTPAPGQTADLLLQSMLARRDPSRVVGTYTDPSPKP
eukprot:13153854-Heterocapsa_arctica.AAC.1